MELCRASATTQGYLAALKLAWYIHATLQLVVETCSLWALNAEEDQSISLCPSHVLSAEAKVIATASLFWTMEASYTDFTSWPLLEMDVV